MDVLWHEDECYELKTLLPTGDLKTLGKPSVPTIVRQQRLSLIGRERQLAEITRFVEVLDSLSVRDLIG